MENIQHKSKRFLLPILSLVLVSILLMGTISAYITITVFKTHMYEDIEETKEEYTLYEKKRIYRDVQRLNNSIKYKIATIESNLKDSLAEKIKVALNMTEHIYSTYKDTLSKKEIREKIAKTLSVISFNENRSYYFMYDNSTKIIFGHPMKKFIGKDMTNFKDSKGQNIMDLDSSALKNKTIAFNTKYFSKPNSENSEFPKITCIAKFEELDIVLGIGEYLDVIEKRTKEYVLNRFSKINNNQDNKYLFIMDLHNIEGGDDFATIIFNSNDPKHVGSKISDDFQGFDGSYFRKDFLKLIEQRGEGYMNYLHKKPLSDTASSKVSYFYLQKDWNWIIGSGFYTDDLEIKINKMKNAITEKMNDTIKRTLFWVVLLSLIAIMIAIYVSFRIDKTIKQYTNQIIEYEHDQIDQQKLLMEQSKHASMGEMIGNIAHQWRQPLSVISMGATGMKLEKELGLLDDAIFNKTCDAINDNAQYLSETIDDFRNFIKGDRNKSFFSLTKEIESFLHLVDGTIKSNSINMICNFENKIMLNGYENEIIQCLINIFNNAKDALIESKIENKLIFITTFITNDNAVISIKDNAKGIPNNVIAHIFEPYFTTKHKAQGTGLGLSMSYNFIVKGMKGTLSVENVTYKYEKEEYTGAEFIIMLPMS